MREAARNEGGGADLGMGQMMSQTMGANFSTTTNGSSADSESVGADDAMQKLAQLKKIYQAKLISQDEYSAKKKEILDNL